jgi:hypothetical protein
MALRKVRIKKQLLIDTLIASVVVQQAPKLINEYLFKTKPLTGMVLQLSGGAAAYLIGMIMKKDTIANIGIALAGADVVNEMVGTTLLGQGTSVADFVSVDSAGNLVNALSDYTDSPSVMDYQNYQNAY